MDPDQKRAYIQKYPGSRYANKPIGKSDKEKPKKAPSKPDDAHKAPPPKPEPSSHEKAEEPPQAKKPLAHRLKNLFTKHPIPAEDKKFFDEGGAEPGSEQRRAAGKLIKDKSVAIIDHLKGQHKEWKHAMKAVHKLASGKHAEMEHHEKKALKSVSRDLLISVASVAITGGLAHGVGMVIMHLGTDVVRDAILKAGFHGAVHGNVFDMMVASNKDEEFLKKVIAELVKMIESGEIPDAAWEAAIKELSKEHSKKQQKQQKKQ